jgi:aminopeptidase N
MIGNNETYRAALDEGFTQFITSWALEKLDGPYLTGSPEKSRYKRSHRIPTLARDARVYDRYLSDAVRGEDKPLNTHSNDFNGALGHENGYSNVYYKTATMLYNLQYVLGDELFLNAMKHYVAQWKMAHPYFEDFRQSIISYTHQDLNWFFDQWMETTKRLDYGVKSVRKTHIRDQYKITFKRQEEMQMPVDFRITSRDLTEYNYTIPNTYFSKQKNSTVLPKWYGWGMFNRTYTTKVIIPSGIDVVQIDPTNRLGDMNMLNNSKVPGCAMPRETYSFRFDNLLNQPFDWKRYNAYWRPDVWWNSIDGLKLGLHLDGSYMNVLRKFHGTVWFNTRALSLLKYRAFEGENWWKNVSPVDYTMRYETPLTKINRRINWGIESRFMDGFARHSTNVSYQLTGKDRFTIEATTLYRSGDITNAYLFYPQEWSSYSNGSLYRGVKNSYLQMQFQHLFASQIGQGVMRYTLRAPLNYQYAFLQAEHINKKAIGKFDIHSRGFLRVGIGNDIPYESALFLQGANPEEMMESKFTRSQGVVPLDLGGMSTNSFSNLHAGGGLNLRGYTGYYAIDENGGTLYTNYKGRSGASVNVEVEFDRLIRFKPKKLHDVLHIDTYFFGDAGVISRGLLDINNIPALNPVREWSKIRMDAGLGAAFTIKRFGPFEKVQPFTVRIDCPFFISAPPAAQPNEFDVRWVIGFSRAF